MGINQRHVIVAWLKVTFCRCPNTDASKKVHLVGAPASPLALALVSSPVLIATETNDSSGLACECQGPGCHGKARVGHRVAAGVVYVVIRLIFFCSKCV